MRRYFEVHFEVDLRFHLWLDFTGPHFLDRTLQKLAIQIEADGLDVPMLLTAQKVTGASKFKVEGSNPEASASSLNSRMAARRRRAIWVKDSSDGIRR
jgi:hypothetical protein